MSKLGKDHDKPVNAANPVDVKRQNRKDKNAHDQDMDDLRRLLDEPHGRRYIWRVLEMAGVFKTSFTGNSTTFFNEGKRQVGLNVIGDITEANPDALVTMMKESKRREEE